MLRRNSVVLAEWVCWLWPCLAGTKLSPKSADTNDTSNLCIPATSHACSQWSGLWILWSIAGVGTGDNLSSAESVLDFRQRCTGRMPIASRQPVTGGPLIKHADVWAVKCPELENAWEWNGVLVINHEIRCSIQSICCHFVPILKSLLPVCLSVHVCLWICGWVGGQQTFPTEFN